ncbi:hypothetical protein Tco_0846501 [Tanacetum coccineum]
MFSRHHSLLFLVEEMEETLEQPLGLLEFRGFSSFNLQELVHGNHHMINKIEFPGKWIRVIGLDMLKESCEKHDIGKSHLHHELMMDPREEEDRDWDGD